MIYNNSENNHNDNDYAYNINNKNNYYNKNTNNQESIHRHVTNEDVDFDDGDNYNSKAMNNVKTKKDTFYQRSTNIIPKSSFLQITSFIISNIDSIIKHNILLIQMKNIV